MSLEDIGLLKGLASSARGREELEKLREENASLRSDIQANSEYIGELQKELNELKKGAEVVNNDEFARIKKELADSMIHSAQLEKAVQYLRSKLEEVKTDREILSDELLAIRENSSEVDNFEENNQELVDLVNERTQQLAHLEREVAQLKEEVILNIQEVRGFGEQWEELEETLTSHPVNTEANEKLEKKVLELKVELERKYEEALAWKEKYEEISGRPQEPAVDPALQEKMKFLEGQRLDLEARLKVLNEQLREKESIISSNVQRKSFQDEELQQFKRRIQTLEIQINEREVERKTLQQHLAKKVREFAQLNEKYEEQKRVNAQQQAKINGTQTKIAELGNAMQAKQEQERRLETKLNEVIKGTEVQLRRADEELTLLKTKVENLEHENRELRQVKEKYLQMAKFFSNSPADFEPPEKKDLEPIARPVEQKEEVVLPPKPSAPPLPSQTQRREPERDLFYQNNADNGSYKTNLFDS